jgi:hypothetical protein
MKKAGWQESGLTARPRQGVLGGEAYLARNSLALGAAWARAALS